MKLADLFKSIFTNDQQVGVSNTQVDIPKAKEVNFGSDLNGMPYNPMLDIANNPYNNANTSVSEINSMIQALNSGSNLVKNALMEPIVEKGLKDIGSGYAIFNDNKGKYTFSGSKRKITVDEADKMLLNFIAKQEHRGYDENDYNVAFNRKKYIKGLKKPITDMTISEVYELQKKILKDTKGTNLPTSAVGRYQFMGYQLPEVVKYLGLDPDKTKFTPEVQDALAVARLYQMRGYSKWKAGKLSNKDFAAQIAKEWASVQNPFSGTGNYPGQKAPGKFADLNNVLNSMKTYYRKTAKKKI
jgi:hypothetical protein